MKYSRRRTTKLLTLMGLAAVLGTISPLAAQGQQKCPPEVAAAEKMVRARLAADKQAKAKTVQAGARTDSIEAPRSEQQIQAPRGGEQQIQAPRGGEQQIQAPRGGEQQIQAPRGGEQQIQAPRGGEQQIQAPRGGQQEIQAPRGTASQETRAPRTAPAADQASLKKAQALVKEARAACNQGNNAAALEKAKAAMELLR